MRDVAVIGGGPGGSTAAGLLAQAGHDVVLFEREQFPRFHIGESLLPHNMRIFDRLGVTDNLKEHFIEKWGVEFVSSDGALNRLFYFEDALDPRYPVCFQVPRSEFDALLLESAGRRGAEVHQGATVKGAHEEDDGSWRLQIERRDGDPTECRARFLVDASGRDGLLARQRGLRSMDANHRRAAVFGHFRGVARPSGRDAGNIRIVMMRDGWFWIIPFSDGRSSVGVVAAGARIGEQGLSPMATLQRAIERCPAARALMKSAELVSPVHATSDWSYDSRRRAGRTYLLVGDAAAFIDPVFSTGVLLAMSSGELAADLLRDALRRGHLSRWQRRRYESTVSRHVHGYRRMVAAFYSDAFPRLCFFPETRIGIPEAVLTLLAGDLEPRWRVRWRLEVFYRIAAFYRRFDLGPRVPLHGVFEETAAAANPIGPMPPSLRKSF